MTEKLQNIIRFYHDCYQHEYRTEKISNYYSKSITHRYYPETFDLISKKDYQLPVDSSWGREAYSELRLTSSERKLILGTFFVKGRTNLLGKTRKIFAPLFIHDATLIEQDEIYILEIDQDSIGINPIAFDYMNSININFNNNKESFFEKFSTIRNPFDFDGLYFLSEKLRESYPELDSSLIERRLNTDSRLADLEFVYSSRKKSFDNVIYPDFAVGIVDKPVKSKGVINELLELSQKNIKSPILTKIFFGDSQNKNNTSSYESPVVPVSLSSNQERIIESAIESRLSLVIGPPGTGKSFSIAATAIQAAHIGMKVLVASKNEQACEVIYNKINYPIGIKGVALNASKPSYKSIVAARLKNISLGVGVKKMDANKYKKRKNEVLILRNSIDRLSKELSDREIEELKWGKKLDKLTDGLISKIKRRWIKFQHDSRDAVWNMKQQIHDRNNELKKKEKELIDVAYQNRLYRLLNNHRSEILKLEKAYRQPYGNIAKEIFSKVDYQIILEALPIWICKSSDISDILPLQEELFDLLIIDEASQCDIASSIPLLFRAKSAVIVGDPNQLRHISFISRNKERILKSKYNIIDIDLGYRDRSILDQADLSISNQENVVFLDEHYRSMPDIIDFSNKEFYSSSLKIMTANPKTENTNYLVKTFVGGVRNDNGENIEEAEKILAEIKKVIKKEKDNIYVNSTSVGVISPFRNQVNLIKKLVKSNLSAADIKKHSLLVGTPFSFQGEERDFIYLSFTVDDNTNNAVLRYLDRDDVFNVSITRAKLRQEVFYSIDLNKAKSDTLLTRYLHNQYEGTKQDVGTSLYNSFSNSVLDFLKQSINEEIYQNKIISGSLIDFLIVIDNNIKAIDIVGYPGTNEEQLSIENIKTLERVQIDIFILPFSSWYFDVENTKKELLKYLLN